MKNKRTINAPDVTINEVDEPYMEACDPVVLQAMRREGFAPASTPHEGDDNVEAQLNKYLNEMFANQPLTQETMDRIKAEFVKVGLNPDDFTTKFDKQTGELVIKRKVKGPEYINVEFIIDKPNKGEQVKVDMKEIERKVNELFRDKEMDEKSIDAALVAEAAETMVDLGFDPDKYDVQFKGKTMRIIPKSWNEDAECDIDDGGKNNREFEQQLRATRLAKEADKENQPREWTTDEKVKYAETANALGETPERYFTRLGMANEVVRRIGDLLVQAYLLWQNAPGEIKELIDLEATCDLTDRAMSRAVTYWNNGRHTFKLKMKNAFDADPDSIRDLQLMLGLKQGTSISTQGRCEQA